ncbi:hypothetical protein CFC21_065692 [Triticum aestivum]|uniref:Uncharacterized protein n=2 Tax=Triticum aestivum TaxID=4565 RepID=A0A3B6KGA7_WHEAT|nr:hypothetical protein CFC21_065692 [Triticum aestivum]
MGGVWEDRLGRIKRHLEKTYTRVPPRSSRMSSTLPGEMDSFHLSFSSHYVLDQIDPNAIELEADSDNRFLYKFEARTQKRKCKEMKGARLLEAKTGGRGRSSMVASMGVEECVKTLQSTVEELVSRTSCSRCCMATQPDLPRQGVGKVVNVNKMVRARWRVKILIADQRPTWQDQGAAGPRQGLRRRLLRHVGLFLDLSQFLQASITSSIILVFLNLLHSTLIS